VSGDQLLGSAVLQESADAVLGVDDLGRGSAALSAAFMIAAAVAATGAMGGLR
jgi:hypothetical protein